MKRGSRFGAHIVAQNARPAEILPFAERCSLGLIHATTSDSTAVLTGRLRMTFTSHCCQQSLPLNLRACVQESAILSTFGPTSMDGFETAKTLFYQGVQHLKDEEWSEAETCLRESLRLVSNRPSTLNNLAVALLKLSKLDDARAVVEKALLVSPTAPESWLNQGILLDKQNRHEAALVSYEKAIELKADYTEAYINHGKSLQELRRWNEALARYDHAIKLKADDPEAHYNRGNVLKELKRFDEGLIAYDQAIRLSENHAQAYNNRGVTLQELKRFDEALASYGHAIKIKPDYAVAYSNRGLTLQELKRLDEALASYELAIKIKPDYAEAHWNLSFCRLLMGDFARGWEGYEWRWQRDSFTSTGHHFTQPLWLGKESLQGKTILLHSEQGLGDTLQFCRYAKLASDLGARVIMEVQQPLLGLLGSLDGVAQLVATGSALPAFDYQCPLLSMPLAFKTGLNTIPSPHRYLASSPDKVAKWRAKLGERTKPRIGLVWRGSTEHKNDHKRSIAPGDIIRHLPRQFQYVSLQKEVQDTDKDSLASRSDILRFGEQLDDFTDTAALVELMDVVVTVDTSVAHLTGAMGKPVWILQPFMPDWRWLLDREDSPWYPSARLFRQQKIGDWEPVIRRVCEALARQLT